MQHLSNILILVVALWVMAISASAQLLLQPTVEQTHLSDTIDRTAEDFVTVSLLVADPGLSTYSVLGHACLRMQCPTFDMDYCYTYESENVSNRIGDYLAGKLKMGLFAVPIKDYCDGYREEGRGVYEYKLNLPPEAEQELWRILDEHVAKGSFLAYDYFKRGCAITCVQFIEKALGEITIQYDTNLLQRKATSKEIVLSHCDKFKWSGFGFAFLAAGESEKLVYGSQQLCVPAELVNAWKNATLDGKPFMVQEPAILVEGTPQWDERWFTPMVLALLILCLSIANLFWSKPYFDWLMLAAQTAVGAFMMYLICFSDLCCTSWNWLIIPFNILPAIFWYWRKWWALPYACALMIWCGVMSYVAIWGHVLVNWPHIVLVLAWTLILLKQSTNQLRTTTALLPHYYRTITGQ